MELYTFGNTVLSIVLVIMLLLLLLLFCCVECDIELQQQPLLVIKSGMDGDEYKAVGKAEADTLYEINEFIISLLRYLKRKYVFGAYSTDDPRHVAVMKLLSRYDQTVLEENPIPADPKYTSFVYNKGDIIKICLHDTAGNLHDMNILQFVVIHELAHLAIDDSGHGSEFWDAMRFIENEAVIGLGYQPRDYSKHHTNYCGVNVTNNPLFY